MLRQIRLLYAKPNTLLRTFSIVRHCIVLFCGTIIKSYHLVKSVARLTMRTEKYLVFLSGVVLVQ